MLEQNCNNLVILTNCLNQQSMNRDAVVFEKHESKREDHASASASSGKI